MKKKRGLLWLAPVVLLTGVLLSCPSSGGDDAAANGGDGGDDGRGKANGVKFSPLTASLGKNVSQQFDATVTGNPNDTVIWSLEGKTDPNTVLEGTGRQRVLRIGGDETAETIRITGVAKSNSKAAGYALVYIIDNGNLPIESGLAVSPGRISVSKGSRQPFKAILSATGEAAGGVMWSVEGSISSESEEGEEGDATSITDGVLTVGVTEAAITLTVKASSGNLYGTAVVYISENGGKPPEDALYPSNLGLSVSPVELTLDKEETSQPFTATDAGGDDVTGTAEWSLRDDGKWKHTGSKVVNTSNVYIGSDEKTEYIGVKAATSEGGAGEAVIHVRGNEREPVVINNGVQIQPQPATVAPGGEQLFTATDSMNGGTAAVTWRVSGGKSGTTVTGGMLSVAGNETAAWLTLRAEMDGGRYGTAAVKVGTEEVFTNIPGPVSNGITVNPLAITLVKGSQKQFTAVNDDGNAVEVNWTLDAAGLLADGTGIENGNLSIAAGEGLPWITVKATDNNDESSYGTALVYISSTAEGSHPLTTHGITVSPGTIEVAPGGTKLFTAKLTGTEEPVHVTWGLDPSSDRKAGTTINGNGLLQIAEDEELDTVLVVRAAGNDGKYGTAQVTVKANVNENNNPPIVTGVVVSTGVTVNRGASTTLIAEVQGENNPSQEVMWEITSTGHASETSIDSTSGYLTVASDETKSSITVKATSAEDTTKFGTATVQIPTVTSVSVTPTTAEVAKGGSTTFSASVTVSGGAGQNVTWSVVTSGVKSNTKFPANTSGLFQVASDETVASITIKATSTVDGSKSGTATVSVPQYTVTSVSISPSNSVIVAPVGTRLFSATVTGTNSPPQTVDWTIEGTHHTGTTITGGNLTVAAGETAESFKVRATSTANTGKYGETTVYAYDPHSIKTKFGITTTGISGVTATFNALHTFISGGGLSSNSTKIQLGDYIDLEGGLTVAAYNSNGGFSISANEAATPITTGANATSNPNYRGALLRLIVVGINSFNGKNGNDTTPHVVFQFQNIPVLRRMNSSQTNANGYGGSEMRTYITGKFLSGLIAAGVPESVLWAPARVISKSNSATDTLTDKLWLPTEREILGSSSYSSSIETAENQARLEYYDSVARRIKYSPVLSDYPAIVDPGHGRWYWNASKRNSTNTEFCHFGHSGNPSFSGAAPTTRDGGGVVPAFCVK